jgi:uncharacterized metal-binding protein YceD (DUF177 family)
MEGREFSTAVALDRLSAAPAVYRLEADADARAALAQRFGLLTLDRLVAELAVRRSGDGALAEGWLDASAVQQCVVSLAPVPATVHEKLLFRFEAPAFDAAEVELEADDLDVLPVEGGVIDLGEAVAQSLYLALDPYPRARGHELENARGFLTEEAEAEAAQQAERAARNPFSILKR